MSAEGKGGGAVELGVDVGVDAFDHLGNGGDAGGDCFEGLVGALLAVTMDLLNAAAR